MGRIQNAYEARFRVLLRQVKARRPEAGVRWLIHQASALAARDGASREHALAAVARQLRQRLNRRRMTSQPNSRTTPATAPRFLCDAGLGGLARWLRAAGYEADWLPGVDDNQLLEEARRRQTTILTTDSLLMERRLLRDGHIPALWVSPALTKLGQLDLVLAELDLPLRESRCMSCGGEVRPVEKEAVRERIPPRTYRWLDEYFLCQSCGKLFWHGTHWQNIRRRLAREV